MSHFQQYYDPFEDSFTKQLEVISQKSPQTVRLKYTLRLPNQNRCRYVEDSYIHSELTKDFTKRYPLGFKIINLSPSSHDDHYINVILQVHLQ